MLMSILGLRVGVCSWQFGHLEAASERSALVSGRL